MATGNEVGPFTYKLRTFLKKKYKMVSEISLFIGSDADHEKAVFVTVSLKDRLYGDYIRKDVQPIDLDIRKKCGKKFPSLFTYIGFQLQSEFELEMAVNHLGDDEFGLLVV